MCSCRIRREVALTLHPEFVEKLLWGGKVVGVRIRLSDANPEVVQQLIRQAWLAKAPKNWPLRPDLQATNAPR